MKVEDAVGHLRKLGLDEDEALVFVHLSVLGRPAKVSEVATAAGLPRPRVYRIANRLMQRNFVFSTFTSPVRFQAIGVTDLLRQLESLETERAQDRVRAREELVTTLSALAPPAKQASKNLFRIHQGRPEIVRDVDRLIRDAKRNVDLVTTFPGAVSVSETTGVMASLERKTKQGVAARIIVRSAPQLADQFRWLAEVPHAHLRVLDGEDHVRYVIVDGEQMVLWVVHDAGRGLGAPEDVALWTEAKDFVRTMQVLFDVLWDQAQAPPIPGLAARQR